jgi:hypothetical protein
VSAATIDVDDLGPVRHLSIPVPSGGGVVVLRGRNGLGKSHALAAVSALAGAGDRPPTRDGQRAGHVEGLGARLTVGLRTTRSGELEARAIDGADPSQLVDPGIKDLAAADRRRIEALCRLAGVRADLGLFASVLPAGGEDALRRVASPATIAAEDLPAMAAGLRRDLQAAARAAENEAQARRGEAEGYRGAYQGVDLAAPHDRAELGAAAEAAAVALARAQEQRRGADEARAAAARAREAVERAAYDGPSAEDAARAEGEARTELARIREQLASAESLLSAASRARAAAVSHERAVAAWRDSIEAAERTPRPEDAELAELDAAAKRARAALSTCEVVRRAIDARAAQERALAISAEAERRGAALRDAARDVDQALSAALDKAGTGLRVLEGRLVLDTDRGAEPFAELSPGERWRVALDVALSTGGPASLLVIPQEAWEAMDPINRAAVGEHARRTGVVVLTAEADEGELRAEPLDLGQRPAADVTPQPGGPRPPGPPGPKGPPRPWERRP